MRRRPTPVVPIAPRPSAEQLARNVIVLFHAWTLAEEDVLLPHVPHARDLRFGVRTWRAAELAQRSLLSTALTLPTELAVHARIYGRFHVDHTS